MQIDTSGLDLGRLARRLDAEYDLGITSLTFVPRGEDAYSYVAEGRAGTRSFVRAQPGHAAGLEAVYAATSALHRDRGLRAVVAPYPTRRGRFTWRQAGCTVAVFPFVDGVDAYRAGLSDEGVGRAAALLAALHASGRAGALPPMPRETFANPFAPPIRRALAAAATPDRRANAHQRRVGRLLLAEQADLLATLALMRRLRAVLRRLDLTLVPTHGDPNLANIIVDGRGELHLTDWGEVAWGPPERDLHHFRGDRFEVFLRRYLVSVGPVRLHERLFEFYLYRWALQEIADYTGRILFGDADRREDEHAWAELMPYLPVPHAEIRAGVREVAEVLRKRPAASWSS